jgi:hypothetical protein
LRLGINNKLLDASHKLTEYLGETKTKLNGKWPYDKKYLSTLIDTNLLGEDNFDKFINYCASFNGVFNLSKAYT